MKISDRGMTVELDDDDPRASRIRALLFEQPGAAEPIATLWGQCSNDHRDVLVAIASAGEVTQADLETKLGLNGVELRGRHGGLAKIAKRLGVEYPIRSAGTHRDARRFSLAADVAQQVRQTEEEAMSHSITDDTLRTVTSELGDEFDSHDVIFSIMRRYPREYVTDLYGFVSSTDPILSLHASLGKRLLGLDTLTPTERVKSLNVRGEETENQRWRRKK